MQLLEGLVAVPLGPRPWPDTLTRTSNSTNFSSIGVPSSSSTWPATQGPKQGNEGSGKVYVNVDARCGGGCLPCLDIVIEM